MNTGNDNFVEGLTDSLDKLAHLAPPGPDAARMHAILRRRRNHRIGGTVMAIVGVLILGALMFMQHQTAQLPPQKVAETPQPAPLTEYNRSEPSPLAMPAVKFDIISHPGPGLQTRVNADMPSMSMPDAMTNKISSVCMRMTIPNVSMPKF